MFVDERGPYKGNSLGAFQGMDLAQLLYIGGVSDFGVIHKDTGFQTGFVGKQCVEKLKNRSFKFNSLL